GWPAIGSQESISSVLWPRNKHFQAQVAVPPWPHRWSVSFTLTFLPSHAGGSKRNCRPNGEIHSAGLASISSIVSTPAPVSPTGCRLPFSVSSLWTVSTTHQSQSLPHPH